MPAKLSDLGLSLILGESGEEIPTYDAQEVGSGTLNAFVLSKEGEVRTTVIHGYGRSNLIAVF